MKQTLLIALVLATAGIAFVPTASAEPCDVPGCNVGPAVMCAVCAFDAKPYKGTLECL